MNNVCLIGRLTRDPEMRTTASGLVCCQFSIAVNGKNNANGEPHVDYVNIITWRTLAENVSKYCKKGSLIGLTGRIQSSSYQDKDNVTRYTTKVIADNIRFLDTKKEESESSNNSNSMSSIESDEIVLSDDDLPF